MTEKFEAIYFDGLVNKKRRVTLAFGPTLDICEDGAVLSAWSYADVRSIPAPSDVMRLRAIGAAQLAQLEVRDPESQREIERRCPKLADDEALHADGSTLKIVGWSLAATVSLVGLIWFGVPFAADRLAPLVPVAWEKRLGDAAEGQVREIFDGKSCASPKGAAALAKLSQRLQDASGLRLPATIEAISSKSPNAFALPGGKVFILAGLLEKAQSQDEILGVLAHEFGHLQNRDHLRRVIADGGIAYLFGLLFGDVTGGGAIVLVGKTLLTTANSRDAEAQADAFAAKTLDRLGRPAKPMGELLLRVTGKEKDGFLTILNDHPLSEDRLAKLAAADKATADPVLTDDEWKALQKICD
ncbi:M48 family metallopeptidase [Methylocystis hirsuta]|uniref:Metalloendopeptidase n=1 Tax=Methylocystis hirsuta TaxID=369798 RepID=A0A3M9XQI4_9HYPH|nr:M48 family metallopeptidase [Methylocystis hirsuta]RNJ49150.1 metalloendopeptidase [Methylocystis hirsuta]